MAIKTLLNNKQKTEEGRWQKNFVDSIEHKEGQKVPHCDEFIDFDNCHNLSLWSV